MRTLWLSALPILLLALAPSAPAATIFASGFFTGDDQTAFVPFALAGDGLVTIRTSSYGQGGFFPVLTVFDLDNADLAVVAAGNSGVCEIGMTPPPGQSTCEDIFSSFPYRAGRYLAVVSVYFNLPLGSTPGDGFLMQGQPSFTADLFGGSGPFVDPDGRSRTGFWDLSITGETVVPEPNPGVLLAAGALLLAVSRRVRCA